MAAAWKIGVAHQPLPHFSFMHDLCIVQLDENLTKLCHKAARKRFGGGPITTIML